MRTLEDRTFLLLLAVISIAFLCILWPFFGAIIWGTVTAIMFAPLFRRLSSWLNGRGNLAAFATILIIIAIVIVPLMLVAASLVQELSSLYENTQSQDLDPQRYFQTFISGLPEWALNLFDWFGIENFGAVQGRLSASLAKGSQFLAAQALNMGEVTFNFVISLCVMLYLTFFLLRDGDALARRIRDAVPLHTEHKRALLSKFTTVVRATVKGDILVAIIQGALGGLIFWVLGIRAPLLWAALMAFLSLLPAVGAALVWLPVAIYLLATGAVWQGVMLVAYGVLVIGLVDNALRPILVGKDTKMPDYLVLISTLGGLAIFGLHGFVIGPVIAAMFVVSWQIFSASSHLADNELPR